MRSEECGTFRIFFEATESNGAQRFEWALEEMPPLERKLGRELQLPRVQHRSGLPEIRIG
jgi:hypothetical protein